MGSARTDDPALNDFYVVDNRTRGVTLATRVARAGTSETRRRGLLDTERLEPDSGLWIVPCEAIHTFGMKVRLDIVFLDKNFRVRKIAEDLGPGRISFCLRAHSVLELPAGSVARSGTRSGDLLEKTRRSADD